jgi:beta-lactamase class A
MKYGTKITIVTIVALFMGWLIGYGIEYYYNFQQTKNLITHIVPVRENNFNYKFIYPLLRYDFGDAKYYLENKDLEQKINNYIQSQYQKQNAENISVYYSEPLTGKWSGVNADYQYYPGSLMKVLIMMDYYRQKQLDRTVMQKQLIFSKEINQQIYATAYATSTNLTIGQSYSVQYLIEDMIDNSDNGAVKLLMANDNPTILRAVYDDLDIPAPGDKPNFTISAKDYALFLRILYSATYLSEKNSEEALSIMSKSTYKDGLSAGTPSNVIIAQKFGESVDTDPQSTTVTGTELHNCGIIYAKNFPYILCIMTKAKGTVDQKQLASIIRDISKIIYNYTNP